jgi:Cephalosporin hydroxylase
MNPFGREVAERIEANAGNKELQGAAHEFMRVSIAPKYSYNFSWLGRPIIQYPQDIVAMQELIWSLQPDLIVETGIAHGGSLIFSASMLELNAACGGPADARVVGIDIDIRAHNRSAIEAHPSFAGSRCSKGRASRPRSSPRCARWRPAGRGSWSRSTATTPTRTSSPSSRHTRR